jgi:hypothetical protein
VPYAQPLLDAVELFDELGIGYALIGGIAAMYYGRARFTEDVDFVAVTGHMDILAAHPEIMERHRFDPSYTYKLDHRSGVQVDLWKDQHSDEIIRKSHAITLAARSIQMIDLIDLLAMKLRTRRLKDDYDVSQIIKANSIDEARLRSLVTADEFAWFEAIRKRT